MTEFDAKQLESAQQDRCTRIRDILGHVEYDSLKRSVNEARGLPNAAYWSDEWYALEQERIFKRGWVFAGARAELSEPGKMKPIRIGGVPLVLVHGKDGQIRAFQNVCRHRGMQLVAEPCHKATITCPYHKWGYSLEGKLRSRLHFQGPGSSETFKDEQIEDQNLIRVALEERFGCLFVNISGTAEPIDDWLSPLMKNLANYDLSTVRWAGRLDFGVDANWKLIFENYMESYHVFAIHPRLINFAPMETRWSGEWQSNTFINSYEFEQVEAGRGEGLPHYPNLGVKEQHQGIWFLSLPQFAVEVFPDQFAVFVTHPEAPNKTREEIHLFLIGDDAATGDEFAEARNSTLKMWNDLNKEDISILEGMQQGRLCPGYDGGRLSPFWEEPNLEFAQRIVEMIEIK